MAEAEDLGIGHLTDVEPIGHGGFSWVYAATDTQLRRRVAVKVLNEIKTEADRRRFDRECEILGRLSSHPHIVTVFSAGFSEHNRPYMVMELVSGGSIDDLLVRQGRVNWNDAIEITQAAAGALVAAHGQGVLHRDIKPENILLEGREPRLADFGIAMLRDSAGATSTKITASWLHAPPETFENRRDERSDLYSLASTLYTMIGGTAPFWRPGEDSLNPLVLRLMSEGVAPLDPALAPPELNAVILSALAKDPADRPPSVAAFGEQLGAIRSAGTSPSSITSPAPAATTQVASPPPADLAAAAVPTGPPPLVPAGTPAFAGPDHGQGQVPAQAVAMPPHQPVDLVAAAPATSSTTSGTGVGSNVVMFALGLLGVIALGALVVLGVMALGDDQASPDNTEVLGLSGDVSSSSSSSSSAETTDTTSAPSDGSSVPTEASSIPASPTTTETLDQATMLTGTWQGTYVCSQGVTGLTLSIDAGADGTTRALFDFYAVPENPGLPSGSFTMNGVHTPGRLELVADEWINQPPNYVTADISANVGESGGELLSGELVAETAACSVFTLSKIDDDFVTIPG